MPTSTSAVAFDFNGTLSDDEQLLFEIFADLFAEHLDWRLDRSEYFGPLAGLSDRAIIATVVREHAQPDADRERLVETLLSRRGQDYRHRVDGRSPVHDQTRDLVRALHAQGTPLAVVTGAQRADVEHVLAQADIADCFAAVITSEDVAEGKPAPEGYLRAADLLGVPTAQVVAVEDTVAGLRAARSAGMRCVALTGTHDRPTLARENATVVDALTPQLLDLIAEAGSAG